MKIAQAIAAYVASKQSLGMRFVTEARTLKSFCRTIGDVDMEQIDPARVRCFLDGTGPVTLFWHRKLDALRGFYRFALAREYVTTSPLPTAVPQPSRSFVPYIYSLDEVRRLIDATHNLDHRNLSGLTCRTLLLMLYGTGLRISEALGLDITDVNQQDRLLYIRETKFYKTRLVPTGPDLTKVLATYAAQRNQHSPPTIDDSFLLTRCGVRPSRAAAESVFQQLREAAGVRRTDNSRYQPRLHDFRHYPESRNMPSDLGAPVFLGHFKASWLVFTRHIPWLHSPLRKANSLSSGRKRPTRPGCGWTLSSAACFICRFASK
jgi:site-specific recombinase XerD